MFSNETIKEIEAVAREERIDAALLLTVAEVESGGKAFAFVSGKKEPLIRFEGHYFDRLVDPSRREEARKLGLASPKTGRVKNPSTQHDRWQLLYRAAKIDRVAALQSVSWGIGQVMGTHWKALGYASIDELVSDVRVSVSGQVRLMVRFIRVNGLIDKLVARDWAGFALLYNGPAYKRNNYHTRLAAAYARHKNSRSRRHQKFSPLLAIGSKNKAQSVADLQMMLTAAGYAVAVSGYFDQETDQAVRRFQKNAGLNVDGVYGPVSHAALVKSVPKLGSLKMIFKFIYSMVGDLAKTQFKKKF